MRIKKPKKKRKCEEEEEEEENEMFEELKKMIDKIVRNKIAKK